MHNGIAAPPRPQKPHGKPAGMRGPTNTVPSPRPRRSHDYIQLKTDPEEDGPGDHRGHDVFFLPRRACRMVGAEMTAKETAHRLVDLLTALQDAEISLCRAEAALGRAEIDRQDKEDAWMGARRMAKIARRDLEIFRTDVKEKK